MLLVILLHYLSPTGRLGARALAGFVGLSPLDAPVEDVVVLITLTNEEVTEQLAQIRVVGFVIETKSARVVQEDAELVGEPTAEQVGGCGHLLLHDTVVLLLLCSGLQALPRKGPAEEVHEDVSQGLQVIATGLFNTKMSVDRGVTSCACQVLVLSVRNMKMGLGVPVLLRKAEIDDVDLVATFSDTHKEVVGLDITMDEVTRVNILYPGDLVWLLG